MGREAVRLLFFFAENPVRWKTKLELLQWQVGDASESLPILCKLGLVMNIGGMYAISGRGERIAQALNRRDQRA